MSRRSVTALLLAAVLTTMVAGTGRAAVVTSVEPRLVEEMDTLRLTLHVTGQSSAEALDLSALEKDFEVLGRNTQSQFRSVNGRVESWVEYQISLRPRRTGELLVPSITIGKEHSEAVQVMVREMDPSIKQSIEHMVFFETELSANPVYVQAETILKRRLYYSNGVQIYSDLPGVPEIPNAVVIPLGEAKSHSTLRDGQRYGVIEQQFAIFPEQSGTLVIPEISITSSVRLQSGGRLRRSGIRIGTEEQHVQVLPIPAEYPRDEPWIPATDVRITQTWTPDRSAFKVGEQLNRNLSVTVVGNTGSAIPPLGIEFPEDFFKWYPEAPALDDDNGGRQIIGTRIEGYSLIPLRPGATTLPQVGLTWWDTDTNQVRLATVPTTTLSITGGIAPKRQGPEQQPAAPETGAALPAASDGAAPSGLPVRQVLLLALLGVLAVAAAVAAGLRFTGTLRRQRAGTAPARGSSAGAAERPTRRAALSRLKQACSGNDLHAIRDALVSYLEAQASPGGDGLAPFIAVPDNALLWRRLNEALYGRSGEVTITGAEVLQAVGRMRKRSPRQTEDPLPGLFA